MSTAQYAFEHYMFGFDLPVREFDWLSEADRAYQQCVWLGLTNEGSYFSALLTKEGFELISPFIDNLETDFARKAYLDTMPASQVKKNWFARLLAIIAYPFSKPARIHISQRERKQMADLMEYLAKSSQINLRIMWERDFRKEHPNPESWVYVVLYLVALSISHLATTGDYLIE